MSPIQLVGDFRLFFLVFSLFPCVLSAQFDKANALFEDKRYAAAAPLFEEGLRENESLVAKTRLAFCYRMLNRTEHAERLYAEVVEHEKMRAEASFFYAEALMSNGKYADAKTWFLRYHALRPDDSLALRRAEACDLVPSIQPYFKNLRLAPFSENSEADDNAPAFWRGGLVFASDRATGPMILKEKSGWTGRDFVKIWFAPFDADSSQFERPQNFSPRLNHLNQNTANASFSADCRTVIFARNGNTANRRGEYAMQLYEAERGRHGWKRPRKLPFCQREINYLNPAISPDGQRLFYAASAGGVGGFDLFVAEKNRRGNWARPRNLGPLVNTPAHEAFPFAAADGRLFFCSKGHLGYGGFDVFVTQRDSASGQWLAPKNLGQPINSSLDDIGFCLAAGDSLGAFSSARSGAGDDIFLFWLGEKPRLREAFFPEKTARDTATATAVQPVQKIENQEVAPIAKAEIEPRRAPDFWAAIGAGPFIRPRKTPRVWPAILVGPPPTTPCEGHR